MARRGFRSEEEKELLKDIRRLEHNLERRKERLQQRGELGKYNALNYFERGKYAVDKEDQWNEQSQQDRIDQLQNRLIYLESLNQSATTFVKGQEKINERVSQFKSEQEEEDFFNEAFAKFVNAHGNYSALLKNKSASKQVQALITTYMLDNLSMGEVLQNLNAWFDQEYSRRTQRRTLAYFGFDGRYKRV